MTSLPLVHRDHRRTYGENWYVYPVVSRRSKGLSLGINLNPDKVCNFDCIYCQVDRSTPGPTRDVDVPRLIDELEAALDLALSGELFQQERFRSTPPALRRLNDIAFSGDGEPTTCPEFAEVVQAVAEVKRRRGLESVKLVLITNATMFHRPAVQQGLALLAENNGEIWAKLEAGTEAYYRLVERSSIPFGRVLDNILLVARQQPLIIQALFMQIHGAGPDEAELEAFCQRLNEILARGGQLQGVQVYTVARLPAESYVTPLPASEVDAIAARVRQRTGLPVEAFYGPA